MNVGPLKCTLSRNTLKEVYILLCIYAKLSNEPQWFGHWNESSHSYNSDHFQLSKLSNETKVYTTQMKYLNEYSYNSTVHFQLLVNCQMNVRYNHSTESSQWVHSKTKQNLTSDHSNGRLSMNTFLWRCWLADWNNLIKRLVEVYRLVGAPRNWWPIEKYHWAHTNEIASQ